MRCELPIGICLDCNDPTNTVFACCHRLRHACGVSPASLAGTLGHLACYDLDVVYRDDFIVVHLEMAFCYLEGPDFVAVVVVLEMALQSSESVSMVNIEILIAKCKSGSSIWRAVRRGMIIIRPIR